jgi:hypothetical protein
MSFVTAPRIVFRRFTASLLIALVALPFTAPFSTCDLSMLLSVGSPAGPSRAVIHDRGRSTSIEEASTQAATASVLEEEQFKDTMLPAVATVAAGDPHAGAFMGPVRRASAHRLPLVALRL